jgi:galactonate dehydratase
VAALVHVLCSLPVATCMEVGGAGPTLPPHLTKGFVFQDGKLWPQARPGLGVEFDPTGAELVSEITARSAPIPMYRRPDGSFTNW